MLLPFALLCSLVAVSQCIEQDTHNPLEQIHLHSTELSHHYHGLKVHLTSNVTEISGKDGWVEVSWSGFMEPSFDDWIGVIAPADAEVKDSTPVKYSRAAKSPEHMSAGRGSVKCAPATIHMSAVRNMLFAAQVPNQHALPANDDTSIVAFPVDISSFVVHC